MKHLQNNTPHRGERHSSPYRRHVIDVYNFTLYSGPNKNEPRNKLFFSNKIYLLLEHHNKFGFAFKLTDINSCPK